MKIMATCLTLNEVPKGGTARAYKGANGKVQMVHFKYWEPFINYFRFYHQIDDHNRKRHPPIYLEEIWTTQW